MDLGQPVDLYCERLGPGLTTEPLNAFSNLAFMVAALWLLSRPREAAPAYARVLAWLVFAIGWCSLSFHVFANVGTEWLDVLSIALYIWLFVACWFRRFAGWPWWAAALAVPGFLAFGKLVTLPFAPGALNGSVDYLPPLFALLLMAAWLLLRRQQGGGKLALAATVFSASLVLRTGDQAWCTALPIGTHWLWHCLNAVTLTLVTLSLDYPCSKEQTA